MSKSTDPPPSPDFADELVFVKVEETVHCITKSDLTRWGGVFKDMFGLPQGAECEGKVEENPITLADCTNSQFEALMEVIAEDGVLFDLQLTKDQWISVLKLSTRWDMAKVRVLAVTELRKQTLSPVEKVLLGSENNVMSLFVEGCASLASFSYNTEKLQDLATDFGWDFAARIMWVVSPAGTKIDRMVGIPKGDMKCQRCSATLVIVESSDPAPRRGSSGSMVPPPPPPVQPSHYPQPQPGPHHPIPPPTFANTAQHPGQTQAQAQLQQQQRYFLSLQQQHAWRAKRSLSLQCSCPTPMCAGLADVREVRLGASGAVAGGLMGLIEKAFSEKMKEMY